MDVVIQIIAGFFGFFVEILMWVFGLIRGICIWILERLHDLFQWTKDILWQLIFESLERVLELVPEDARKFLLREGVDGAAGSETTPGLGWSQMIGFIGDMAWIFPFLEGLAILFYVLASVIAIRMIRWTLGLIPYVEG